MVIFFAQVQQFKMQPSLHMQKQLQFWLAQLFLSLVFVESSFWDSKLRDFKLFQGSFDLQRFNFHWKFLNFQYVSALQNTKFEETHKKNIGFQSTQNLKILSKSRTLNSWSWQNLHKSRLHLFFEKMNRPKMLNVSLILRTIEKRDAFNENEKCLSFIFSW